MTELYLNDVILLTKHGRQVEKHSREFTSARFRNDLERMKSEVVTL